jgi:hypothetical protein
VQSVNFQGSAWGTHEAGRFTINLGITIPAMYEGYLGRTMPKVPAGVRFPISARIGGLMPLPGRQADIWWDVDESTDVTRLGEEIADALASYAVPWFEKLATRKALIDAFEHRTVSLGGIFAPASIALAVLVAEDGDVTRARSMLTSLLGDGSRIDDPTVRRVADRLAIVLDP